MLSYFLSGVSKSAPSVQTEVIGEEDIEKRPLVDPTLLLQSESNPEEEPHRNHNTYCPPERNYLDSQKTISELKFGALPLFADLLEQSEGKFLTKHKVGKRLSTLTQEDDLNAWKVRLVSVFCNMSSFIFYAKRDQFQSGQICKFFKDQEETFGYFWVQKLCDIVNAYVSVQQIQLQEDEEGFHWRHVEESTAMVAMR